MKVRDVRKLIERDGWRLDWVRGSHRQFKHPSKPGVVTIAGHPADEIHPKTLRSILRQAGLKWSGATLMKSKFLVVIEKGDTNYSAYSPDVPGCVATGRSIEETLANIRSALQFHLEGMAEHGEQMPVPQTLNYYVQSTDEISSDDILTHVVIDTPEIALA